MLDKQLVGWFVLCMAKIGIFEAKTKLSELCTQVENAGMEYVITRRGHPVARITGIAPAGGASSGLFERMAQTEAEHGKISEGEADFPDVWLQRRSGRPDPLSNDD